MPEIERRGRRRGWVAAAALAAVVALGAAVAVVGGQRSSAPGGSGRVGPGVEKDVVRIDDPARPEEPMPEPTPGSPEGNVVVVGRQVQSGDDELFGRSGHGVVMLVENRNYSPVEIEVKAVLYDESELVATVPGGPHRMEARETLLIPIPLDAQTGYTRLEAHVVRVTVLAG